MIPFSGSPSDFLALFRTIPGLFVVMRPDLIVVEVSDAYLKGTQTTRDQLIGRTLFDVFFPEPIDPMHVKNGRELQASLRQALETKAPQSMSILRYDLPKDETGRTEHYWAPMNLPVLNAEGDVIYLIHRVEEATAQYEAQKEIKRLGQEALQQAHVFDSLLSATADFNYIFDREGRFSYINRALLSLLGLQKEQALGRNFHDLNYPFDLATKLQAQIEQVFTTGQPVKDETTYTNFENKCGYYEYIFVPIFDKNGGVEAVAGSTRDISEHRSAQTALLESEHQLAELNHNLEKLIAERTRELERSRQRLQTSLEEKEVLLREVHHRVKNNLQVITNLLRLQSRTTTDLTATAVLTESQNRIHSMALIHELLYQSSDLSRINFKNYLKILLAQLFRAYNVTEKQVVCTIEAEDVLVDLDRAIPCALITTELVSNALKHGFQGQEGGRLTIAFSQNATDAMLSVEDNGVGLPENFKWKKSSTLGFTIIHSLSKQLDGQGEFSSRPGGGTRFDLTFSLKATVEVPA